MKLKKLTSEGFSHHLALAVIVVIAALGGTYYLLVSHADSPNVAITNPTKASKKKASCSVSAILVNSCRPWLGAVVNGYPEAAADEVSQTNYEASQIGRQLDIVHTYHQVGQNSLTSTDVKIVDTPGQMLFTDWKPTPQWGNIASQNGGIDEMANSIKALGSHKIFLTLHHEPENDVTNDGSKCTSLHYKGIFGTTAQYRAMWAYVENRFTQDGVTNVVWSLDLMNYPTWNCIIPDLYPGDNLIDWIWFNGYQLTSEGVWKTNVGNMYNLLTAGSGTASSGHDYLSKPWGIVEWSAGHGTVAQQEAYFDAAKASLDANQFPKLKGYMVYDSDGNTGYNDRVGYDSNDDSVPDAAKAAHYYNFARDPRFTDAYYTTTTK